MDGETIEEYGKDETDAVMGRPSLLEMSIFGLLNVLLGRGSFADEDRTGAVLTLATCVSSNDCTSTAAYCDSSSSSSLVAVPSVFGATAGQCHHITYR